MDAFDAALSDLASYFGELGIYGQRATVTRPGLVDDGMGGTTDAETTVAADVPCLVQAGGFTREEREIGAQATASKLWSVSFPLSAVAGWTVAPQDRIAVAGVVYEVQNSSDGEGHAVELVATCIKLGA